MSAYRDIIAGGDLIRQRKQPRWWFFGDESWAPWRNLDREVRWFEEDMHAKHAAYKEAQERYVVAKTNVQMDKDMLTLHKLADSEVSFMKPSDESIVFRRQDVKYNMNPNSGNQKQKGNQNNGNGNNQQQNQNGNGGNGGGNNQNQNQNNQNQKGKQQKGGSNSVTLTFN